MSAYEDELKNVIDDPRWRQLDKRLYLAEIEGMRIGVALATSSPQYTNFAVNSRDLERLRSGKSTGKVDHIFVVAMKMNGAGRLEYRGKIEADALYEKLRDRTPIGGRFGPFWTLSPYEIDEDAPF
jgi:hypothetical protein